MKTNPASVGNIKMGAYDDDDEDPRSKYAYASKRFRKVLGDQGTSVVVLLAMVVLLFVCVPIFLVDDYYYSEHVSSTRAGYNVTHLRRPFNHSRSRLSVGHQNITLPTTQEKQQAVNSTIDPFVVEIRGEEEDDEDDSEISLYSVDSIDPPAPDIIDISST